MLSGTQDSDRLWVGDGTVQDVATVILNGGKLTVPVLEFDAGTAGLIYVSEAGGRIESEIRTNGGLMINGRGILELTQTSDYSGGIAGMDWGVIAVEGEFIVAGFAYVELVFAEGLAPELGGAFWSQDRFWTILTASAFTDSTNLSIFGKQFEYGSFYFQIEGDVLGLGFTPIPEPAHIILFVGVLVGTVMIGNRHNRKRTTK